MPVREKSVAGLPATLEEYRKAVDPGKKEEPKKPAAGGIEKKGGEAQASIRPGEFLAARNGAARGITRQQCERVAANLNGRASNAAGVEVVGSFGELPESLRERFADYGASLEGAYDPATGRVWLVAENLASTGRAAEVWCHEQIVHNGLRGLFNENERRVILGKLWLSLGGMGNRTIREIAAAYGLDPRANEAARSLVMEETLARLAEKRQASALNGTEESAWRRIARIIANAIAGLVEKLTGRKSRIGMEQVDSLLAALGQYVMGGTSSRVRAAGEARASLKECDTNSYGIPLERVTEIEGGFTRAQAKDALKKLAGQELPNLLEGITAKAGSKQRDKMTSGVAMGKSKDNGFTEAEHFDLAARIASAWKWAAKIRQEKDREIRDDVTFGKYAASVRVNSRPAFALITTMDTKEGVRLYSAELMTERELRLYADPDKSDILGSPVRSFDQIISRLSGPVKGETDYGPLASIGGKHSWRDIFQLSGKETAELANAPGIEGSFRKKDLGWLQHFFALPHWIAKQSKGFAEIYERQLRRRDECAAKIAQSLGEVPSLFQDGKRLDKKDMASLKSLLWEIEGKPLNFEKAGTVEKYLSDGSFENGREKIRPNPAFYREYEKALKELPATDAARKAMLEIRKSLDQDLANAYNRMAEMSEASDDMISKYRNTIGRITNYFPHQRYGGYYVQAIGPEGNVVYREHFDALTVAQAGRKAREIAAREKANYPDAKWKQGKNTKLPDEVLGSPVDPEAMEQIIIAACAKIEDREQAKQISEMLCASTADVLKSRGWAEHAIGRKGVPGFETGDIGRVLYDYKAGLYGWLTKMDAARDFSRALGRINAKQQPDLWGYASNYIRDMLRNTDRIDRMSGNIKSVAFAWYLGANIKTAAVNATQNIIVGVPRLEMDVNGAGASWLKAAMDAIVNRVTGNTGKNLAPDEARLVKELYEENVITDAFMEEVRGHLSGLSFASGWNKFTKVLGLPMGEVERFNRASLALAAFRAAMAGRLKPAAKARYGIEGKATYEQAKQFATEIVNDSHFVYGKTNLPEMLRGNATGRALGSMYTFRTFSHNMLNMWLWALRSQGKEGAKLIAKSIGATIALGGLTAIPFYASLAALCQAISGDGDDWLETIRAAMPESNIMRDVACYGVPALAGVNIGGSLQMETPVTQGMRKAENPDDFLGLAAEGLIGIPWDLAKKGMTAAGNIAEGDFWHALEQAVPTFVKNGMQAWKFYTEGQTTKKGRPINNPGVEGPRKYSGGEAAAKALGFQPVSSTKSYAAYAAEKRRETVRSREIDRVVEKFLKAARTKDSTYRSEGIAMMRRWNERMEKEGRPYMMFNMKNVIQRVKRRSGKTPNAKDQEKGKRQMAVWGV